MRTNRKGFPKQLKHYVKKGLAVRGDSMTVQHKNSNMTVSLWQDSCLVVIIAINVNGTTKDTVKRRMAVERPTHVHHLLPYTTDSW